MDKDDIPQDVQVLLSQDIQTFEQLEALLLLRTDPTTVWGVAEVGARLNVSDEIALEALESLATTGLVEATGSKASRGFRYSPANRTLDDITARLASAYEQSRFEVLRLMSRNAVDRLRSSAIRTFANAFILKGKKDKEDDGDE